jgi:DNA repair exonuclease SbcCD nuclease subunit
MKIALVTDTHWGARNDSRAFHDHIKKFYDNVFFPHLEENGIDTVIHLGDVVERRKFINFQIAKHFRVNFVEQLQRIGAKLHVIVGNHDVYFKNTNEVNSMEELLGSSTYDVNIYTEGTEVEFDGTNILLMPWINNQNYKQSMDMLNTTTAQVVMGHFEIAGFEMYKGVPNAHGMDYNSFSRFDSVFSGHFHTRSKRENIQYLGTPYEITWSDYDDPRGFHIFDTDTRELEFIPNPYRLFHKVKYNDLDKSIEQVTDIDYDKYVDTYVKVIIEEKSNPYAFDLMMDKLDKVNPIHVSVVEAHKHMDQLEDSEIMDETEDTLTILHHYVDSLEFGGDNTKLNKLMTDLYNDAVNMEIS